MNLRLSFARPVLWLPLLLASLRLSVSDVLLPAYSVWKYLPITNEFGTAWREFDFDDSPWPMGPAQLGYGDQDESTIVPFYQDQIGLKNISTYFRSSFAVTNRGHFTNLLVRLLRDDGAVVYLNGIELFRDNMPTGVVTYATLALTSISAPEENTEFIPHYVQSTALREGINVLAVEIHQQLGTSADISFNLEVVGNALASLPPSIGFRAPFPGATFTPGTNVSVEAAVSDPDGTIARVEFFANSNKLGEITEPPFILTWSNVPVGLHALTAVVTDNTGVQSNTAPLLIRAGGFSLIRTGAVWKYLDDQTDPGTEWRQPNFDDSRWSNGVAQFGFGDGDEATELRWRINELPIITAYFRRRFISPGPAYFSSLMLRLLRDDGGVVYLNGTEVFRSNMPGGEVNYSTYAVYSVGTGPEEGVIYFPTNLTSELLVDGTNTLAVEIHQITQFSSTDMSFDAELAAFPTDAATELAARRMGSWLEFSWPAWTDRLALQSTTNLAPPVEWIAVTNTAENIAGQWTLRLPAVSGGIRFFRLHMQGGQDRAL